MGDQGRTSWNVERRAVGSLKPHPKQMEFGIPRYTPQERTELSADMAANGLEHPIDITPEGVVLGGHERFLSARRLKWEFIDCRVRFDLDTEQKQHAFVLRDNLVRRHLSDSQRANMARQLVIVLGGDPARGGDPVTKGAAEDAGVLPSEVTKRDQIAKAAKETPEFAAVEEAADAGEVHLSTAATAALLPREQRSEVVKDMLQKTGRDKNKALAKSTKRARQLAKETENGVEFWGSKTPATETHPKQSKANMKAIAVLERKLLAEESADEDTIEWFMAAVRTACAAAPGSDLETLSGFLYQVRSALRSFQES